MSYIDIFFIIAFLLCILTATFKGFFHTLFDLFAKFASMIVAKILSIALCEQVYNQFFKDSISSTLYQKLEGVSSVDVGKSVNAALSSIPDNLSGVMTAIGVDKQQLTEKVDSLNLTGDNFIQTLLDDVVSPIAIAICRSLIFIGIFVLISFILKLILKIVLKTIKKKPSLKKTDRLLGGLLGAVRGVIIVVVLVYIVVLVSGFIDSQAIQDAISSSNIIKFGEGAIKAVTGSVA